MSQSRTRVRIDSGYWLPNQRLRSPIIRLSAVSDNLEKPATCCEGLLHLGRHTQNYLPVLSNETRLDQRSCRGEHFGCTGIPPTGQIEYRLNQVEFVVSHFHSFPILLKSSPPCASTPTGRRIDCLSFFSLALKVAIKIFMRTQSSAGLIRSACAARRARLPACRYRHHEEN
jgi:hypothetical protein